MKDAPIEDRRQGNGNDEHKLPESINKSAKKSENLTTKRRQLHRSSSHWLSLSFATVGILRFIVLPVIGLLTFDESRDT
jgi:hypothetical protein